MQSVHQKRTASITLRSARTHAALIWTGACARRRLHDGPEGVANRLIFLKAFASRRYGRGGKKCLSRHSRLCGQCRPVRVQNLQTMNVRSARLRTLDELLALAAFSDSVCRTNQGAAYERSHRSSVGVTD